MIKSSSTDRSGLLLAGLLALCVLLARSPVRAGEASKGPLSALPSKPGPHVAKIKAMADNSWLDLGKPKPDPKYGPAVGRAYTNKMPYAGPLGGAFIYGEGSHGKVWTKRGGGRYFNDDLYFYNINAHAWICVHPGTDIDNVECTLDANGFEIDKSGQAVPIAAQIHGYECNAYLPDLGKFMTLGEGSYNWKRAFKERREKWLAGREEKHPARTLQKHPFFYDAKTGRWQRKVVASGPGGVGVCNSLIHLPGLKKVALYGRKAEFWLYDYSANTWSRVTGKGPAPKTSGYEGVSCYDSRRGRVCAFNCGRGGEPGKFGIYDAKTNQWLASKSQVQPDTVVGGTYSSTRASAHYDSVNDKVILLFWSGKGGVMVYDPEKDEWTAEPVSTVPILKNATHSFYSPEFNAHFLFYAGDSVPNPGVIKAYRYRNARR